MRRTISLIIILTLFVAPAVAKTTGDPIDGNDRTLVSVDAACGYALANPYCNWCWTNCLYAMMFDPDSGWDFGGGW